MRGRLTLDGGASSRQAEREFGFFVPTVGTCIADHAILHGWFHRAWMTFCGAHSWLSRAAMRMPLFLDFVFSFLIFFAPGAFFFWGGGGPRAGGGKRIPPQGGGFPRPGAGQAAGLLVLALPASRRLRAAGKRGDDAELVRMMRDHDRTSYWCQLPNQPSGDAGHHDTCDVVPWLSPIIILEMVIANACFHAYPRLRHANRQAGRHVLRDRQDAPQVRRWLAISGVWCSIIRRNWPQLTSLACDSHYGRPEVMQWCDASSVDYLLRNLHQRHPALGCADVKSSDACAVTNGRRSSVWFLRTYAKPVTGRSERKPTARVAPGLRQHTRHGHPLTSFTRLRGSAEQHLRYSFIAHRGPRRKPDQDAQGPTRQRHGDRTIRLAVPPMPTDAADPSQPPRSGSCGASSSHSQEAALRHRGVCDLLSAASQDCLPASWNATRVRVAFAPPVRISGLVPHHRQTTQGWLAY